MNSALILFPVIAQILLTIALYILLGIRKKTAAKAGTVDENRRGLFDDAWPAEVIKVNNCIKNQFEVPVLFYVVCISMLALQVAGAAAITLAWLFVFSRFAHAFVHTGANHVPTRRRIFMFGVLVVLALTLMLAYALACPTLQRLAA